VGLLPSPIQTVKPAYEAPLEAIRLPSESVQGGIQVALSDRWVGLGTTGTGKTTWARELLQRLQSAYPAVRTYILDSKLAGDFDRFTGEFVGGQIPPRPLAKPGTTQIWQPPVDDVEQYGVWLENILKARQPAIVLIDELSSLGGRTGLSYPTGYFKLLKQGRGLDISAITLTQEAAYIPRQTLGQTTHLVRFRLQNEEDRRKADKVLGRSRSEYGKEPVGKFGFFYRRLDRPADVLEYRNWQEFFSER
jgi:hypothetical protein